ncbi:MAG: TauD/TfdA family dioxygenase [Actinomycetota bacterium]|nr:TauD/TfdA family dioxygenase [Actinomycetota bacterium]
MGQTSLSVAPLTGTVGAEVVDVDADRLAGDDGFAAGILEALGRHGVLVFRDLHLEPAAQVAFCQRLGEIDYAAADDPVPGVMRVTLDRSKNASAPYLKGTFFWHIDGCTPAGDECPQMATVLSAKAVAERGGETEFASTYAAFDALSELEQEQVLGLRVVHSLEASQRLAFPEPSDKLVAGWRTRKTSEHPLVWTHRDGRRSLVLGASTDHVVGMDLDAGRALLAGLLERSTTPERVYRHQWAVGDTVIWDNRGVLHRAAPYPEDSPREMFRTTVLGDEPIE